VQSQQAKTFSGIVRATPAQARFEDDDVEKEERERREREERNVRVEEDRKRQEREFEERKRREEELKRVREEEEKKAREEHRCQFYQHFTSAFFIQKCFVQLFFSYSLALKLFGERILAQKLHI